MMARLDQLKLIKGQDVIRSSAVPPINIKTSAKVVSIDDASTCDLVIIRNGSFERFQCRLLEEEMSETYLQDCNRRALRGREFLLWRCLGHHSKDFPVAAPPISETLIQSMLDNCRRLVYVEFTDLDDSGRPLVWITFDLNCTPPQTKSDLKCVKERDVARSSVSPPTVETNVYAKVISIQDACTCDLVIVRDGGFQRFQCRLLEVDKPQLQDRSLNALKCRDFFVWLCCGRNIREFRTFSQPLNEDQIQDTIDNNCQLIYADFSVLDNTGRPLVTLKPIRSGQKTFNARFMDFDYEENLTNELKHITTKDVARSAAFSPTNISVKAKVVSIHDACTCDLVIVKNGRYERFQCRLLEVNKSNLQDGSLNALKGRDFFAWLCCNNNPGYFPNVAPPLNEDQIQGMLDNNQKVVNAEITDLDKSDRPLVTLKSSCTSNVTFNVRLMEFSHEENMCNYLRHIRGEVIPRSYASPPTNIKNICAKVVSIHGPFTCDLVIVRHEKFERFMCRLHGLDQTKTHLMDGIPRASKYRDFFAWWCSEVSHPSSFPSLDPPWDEHKLQDVLDDNRKLVYAEFNGLGAFGEPLIILRRNPEHDASETLNAVLVEYGYA